MTRSNPQNQQEICREAPPVFLPSTRTTVELPDVAYTVLGYVGMYVGGVHGWELGRRLSRAIHGEPTLGMGRLYRVLRQLERAELVRCRVEPSASRLRYLFTMTAHGESCFGRWLKHIPRGTPAPCQQLLDRLRFAEQLPQNVLLRLLDEAAHECQREIEGLGQPEPSTRDTGKDTRRQLHASALKARMADDRCWLEEVRRLVQRSLADTVSRNGSVNASGVE